MDKEEGSGTTQATAPLFTSPRATTTSPKLTVQNRLIWVFHNHASWPAVQYDNYGQVFTDLSSKFSYTLKMEMGLAILQDKGNFPVARLLGWDDLILDDEGGNHVIRALTLIPVTRENSTLFWNGPFVDWCEFASSHKDRYSGKMGRALDALQEIVQQVEMSGIMGGLATTTATTTATSAGAISTNESNAVSPQQTESKQSQQNKNEAPSNQDTTLSRIVETSQVHSKRRDVTSSNISNEQPLQPRAQQHPNQTNPAQNEHEAAPTQHAKPMIEIGPHDDWKQQVWPKLHRAGWKKRTDGMGTTVFVKPGKKWATGTLGQDFFDSLDSMQQFVVQTYGWKGGEVAAQPPMPTKKAHSKSKNVKRKVSTPFLPKLNPRSSDSPSRVWGLDRKQAKQTTKASNKAKKPMKPRSEAEEAFYLAKNLNPILKQLGWKIIRGNLLIDWYFIRPGCSVEKGELGVHYFVDQLAAIQYCQENKYYETYGSPASTASSNESTSDANSSTETKDVPDANEVDGDNDEASEREVASNEENGDLYLASDEEVVDYNCNRFVTNDSKVPSSQKHSLATSADSDHEIHATKRRKKGNMQVQGKTHVEKTVKAPWWQSVVPPTFRELWPTTLQKLGIKYTTTYTVPHAPRSSKVQYGKFGTDLELQKFLCANGIPDYEKNKGNLTEEEQETLHHWVSFAHVPSIRSQSWENAKLLTDDEALKMLSKVGFQRKKGRFVRGTWSFNTTEELRCHVRSLETVENVPTGRRHTASESVLSKEQNLELRLWAALSKMPLPRFEIPLSWTVGSNKNTMANASILEVEAQHTPARERTADTTGRAIVLPTQHYENEVDSHRHSTTDTEEETPAISLIPTSADKSPTHNMFLTQDFDQDGHMNEQANYDPQLESDRLPRVSLG